MEKSYETVEDYEADFIEAGYIVSGYIEFARGNTYFFVRCPEGHDYTIRHYDFMRVNEKGERRRCNKCSDRDKSLRARSSMTKIKKDLKTAGLIFVDDEDNYENAKSKILVQCVENQHEFMDNMNNITGRIKKKRGTEESPVNCCRICPLYDEVDKALDNLVDDGTITRYDKNYSGKNSRGKKELTFDYAIQVKKGKVFLVEIDGLPSLEQDIGKTIHSIENRWTFLRISCLEFTNRGNVKNIRSCITQFSQYNFKRPKVYYTDKEVYEDFLTACAGEMARKASSDTEKKESASKVFDTVSKKIFELFSC